jgi:hypothetical protein
LPIKFNTFDVSTVPERLDYDPETGVFKWRIRAGGKLPGDVAGTVGPKGYRVICVKGELVRASRLAWTLAHNGVWPKEEIDHINGLKDDNRLANLREATRQENCFNAPTRAGKSGLKGVTHRKGYARWSAAITVRGKSYFLGEFTSPEEAHEAYKEAARDFHGEFYREPEPTENRLTVADFVGSEDPEGRLRDEWLETQGKIPPVNPADITPVTLRAILAELHLTKEEFGRRLGHPLRSAATRYWITTGPIPQPIKAVAAAWIELHRNGLPLPGAPIS